MSGGYRSRNKRDAITSRLRLRTHDYREPGSYFATVCVQQRACLLGRVTDSVLTHTLAGKMVDDVLRAIPDRFPTVQNDGHVVMPNHLHIIVTLMGDGAEQIPDGAPALGDVIHWIKRQTIRGYAEGVRQRGWPPYDRQLWQSGFMEHIIRNDASFDRLSTYMESNPALWEDDTFHPQSLAKG